MSQRPRHRIRSAPYQARHGCLAGSATGFDGQSLEHWCPGGAWIPDLSRCDATIRNRHLHIMSALAQTVIDPSPAHGGQPMVSRNADQERFIVLHRIGWANYLTLRATLKTNGGVINSKSSADKPMARSYPTVAKRFPNSTLKRSSERCNPPDLSSHFESEVTCILYPYLLFSP